MMLNRTFALIALSTAVAIGLAACTGATSISRTEQTNTYEPNQIAAAIRNGVLPAAFFGPIPGGLSAEALAARLTLPSWLGNVRPGTGAPRGYRLVLVFNPVAPVEADALCAAPAEVPTRAAGGDLAIQGAWCFWDRAASRGYLTGAPSDGGGDAALDATVGKLISALLPPKSTPADLTSKGDYPL